MVRIAEIITEKELDRLAKIREDGSKKIDLCISEQVNKLPILDRVAALADTGRIELYYNAVGLARIEGYSWRQINAATSGQFDPLSSQRLNRNYLSFCRNNNIKPVKIQGTKPN